MAEPHRRLVAELLRRHSDINNAARDDWIESKLAGLGDHLVAIAAGIQPEFIAPFRHDFVQHLHNNMRWQVDADASQPLDGDIGKRLIDRQPFDLAAAWIHRIDVVALLKVSPDRFVSELRAIGARA